MEGAAPAILAPLPATRGASLCRIFYLFTSKVPGTEPSRILEISHWHLVTVSGGWALDAAGRYRCLELDHPCEAPWCDGPLGVLENNGWVYSAHCSFKLFATDASWRCLDGKWLFFWGDSNHVDTIRNLLTFVLGITDTSAVTRRFDAVFTNPSGGAGTLRITSIFNGHWNMSMNYLGLHSLRNRGFRQLIRSYFMSGDRVPDVVVLNSGLHDGCYWTSVRIYAQAADFAAQFWSGVMDKVRARGHAVPRVFYQTQMPQGGIDAGKNQATPFTELRDEAGVTYSHPQGWVTLQTLPNEVLVVLQKVIRYWKNFLAVPNLEHSRNLLANKRETFLNRNYD
ncbi:hypothetical protein ZEAMMB73_Zm00001d010428 [Zea mays]|uniref:Uncharacterized protein n=1 Tax=Zea mays TaxID=4577 RepID=A0A1D6FQZ4_MAIZE|nr:hypothetical protein ZEAMMB73_Zm00001d010428 [Zea mays]